MFYFAEAASLPRKKANCRNGNRKPGHYLMLSEAGKADTVCIQVAHPDGMFLAGRGMIPTHNSELVSRRFPAYMLGRNPDLRLLSCSHTADLATSMNRDVQRIMSQDAYRRLFPETRLSDKWVRGSAKNSYRRTLDFFEVVGRRGSLRTAGVGVSIAGNPADGGIIDDPFGKREDADSPTIRQRVWDWYANDFYTRLSRDAWIVLTHTRWHRDDLAGRLLRKMADRHGESGDLCLPALATKAHAIRPTEKAGRGSLVGVQDRETLLAMQRQDARARRSVPAGPGGGSSEWSENLWPMYLVSARPVARRESLATAAVDPSLGKSDKQGDYSAIVSSASPVEVRWVAGPTGAAPTETVRKTILACEHRRADGRHRSQPVPAASVHEFQRQMRPFGNELAGLRIDNRVHKPDPHSTAGPVHHQPSCGCWITRGRLPGRSVDGLSPRRTRHGPTPSKWPVACSILNLQEARIVSANNTTIHPLVESIQLLTRWLDRDDDLQAWVPIEMLLAPAQVFPTGQRVTWRPSAKSPAG